MLCGDVVCNVTAPPSSSAAIWLLPGAWSRASRHHMLHVAESRPDEGGRGDVCAGPAPSYERGERGRQCESGRLRT